MHTIDMAPMNRTEAEQFVSLLKEGRSFVTRFQEQEWGLEYLPDTDRFREWGREEDYGAGTARNFDETITEEQLIEKLMKYYSLEIMKHGLR